MQGYSSAPFPTGYAAGMGRKAKTERTEFGERLVTARQQLGLSQAEVAEALGITQQSYAGWERRETALKPEYLLQLASTLKVTVDHLLGTEQKESTIRQPSGPPGKLRRVFEKASQLPRHQQNKVAEFVEAFVNQHASDNAQ